MYELVNYSGSTMWGFDLVMECDNFPVTEGLWNVL